MIIKFVAEEGFEPSRATDGSAGFDLRATNSTIVGPGGRGRISTGVKVAIPDGWVGKVYSRSGIGFKHGVSLSNGTGVIDSDFRGEIMLSLINHGEDDFVVSVGDRVAQIIFERLPEVELKRVSALDATERGENGFGSTGR